MPLMEDKTMTVIERLKRQIHAARGAIAPDLVLKGGRKSGVLPPGALYGPFFSGVACDPRSEDHRPRL
jgi:hypothetical protein